MKLIFLHGLGQDASSWTAVQKELTDWDCQAFQLFPEQTISYADCKENILHQLRQQQEDFVLVGLSLGGVLALDLSDQDLPHLKGLILSGAQYKLTTNLLYQLQTVIFRLIPKKVFEKQDASKSQLLQILTDLKNLDLTQQAVNCQLPTLVICGSKDKPNLKASQELHTLIKTSELNIIPDGGHTLNTEKPALFAQVLTKFLETIESLP